MLFKLYDDVSLNEPVVDVNVPKDCWMVYWTDNAVFALCDQTKLFVSVHCGVCSVFDLVYVLQFSNSVK